MKEVTFTLSDMEILELERYRNHLIENGDSYIVKEASNASLDKLAAVFLSSKLRERSEEE